MKKFKVIKKDIKTKARIGILETIKGSCLTPLFMPVATLGTVKTLNVLDLKNIGVTTLMCNTYHLLIRPGLDVMKKAGSLAKFINWDMPIFTDSGGFQIFSLSNFVKINNGDVEYIDHITGNKFILTPQEVINVQENIFKSTMFVHLDYPSFYPVTEKQAQSHLDITTKWAKEGLKAYGGNGIFFGINQGSIYKDLRLRSLEFILSENFDGVAIGGLGLGEPPEETIKVVKLISDNKSSEIEKPLYVMGLGRPEDIVELIEYGVDIFDCVLPTRNGRFGRAYTYEGVIILRNNKYTDDFTPIDKNCKCFACKNYTKAFLRHLVMSEEILGITMISLHNVYFYMDLFEKIKDAIVKDNYSVWKKEFLKNYLNQEREATNEK